VVRRPADRQDHPSQRAPLASPTGPERWASTLAHCRSLARRIFHYTMEEGAIDANPVQEVPPLKRRVDPEQIFTEAKRRALTPEEAGRLLAGLLPLFWWDPILTLLGTGLRFGELAGLRRRRVHLNRTIEPCRITLSFTRWPLALLLSKPRACPQSPPRPGTLTCAGT